jgi:hypothetical protein
MGINYTQLKYNVVIPVLKLMGLDSDCAIDLVLGTAAQESAMGKYIRQKGFDMYSKEGAFGIYQIELATHDDIMYRYLPEFKPTLCSLCERLKIPVLTDAQNLIGNLYYATAICRAKYLSIAEKLPDEGDVEGMARYWKKYYNTAKGKGTDAEFISNYNYWCKQ